MSVEDLNEVKVQRAEDRIIDRIKAERDSDIYKYIRQMCREHTQDMQISIINLVHRLYELPREQYRIDIDLEDLKAFGRGEYEKPEDILKITEIPKEEQPAPDRNGLRIIKPIEEPELVSEPEIKTSEVS